MIKIAVAEDNTFLAHAIQEKISFFSDLKLKFIGVNGEDLIQKLQKDPLIDVILMDIQMPKRNGIDTTQLVKQKFPHIKIIMLTVFDDEDNIFKAIQAGADGYLLKDENAGQLHAGILEIINGGAPMSPSIALKALRLLRQPAIERLSEQESTDYGLTKREIDILEQVSKGLANREIGINLSISTGTVRKHIENCYRKLQVHNKMEAVSLAQKERIIN